MNPSLSLFALVSLAMVGLADASPSEADRSRKNYQLALQQWDQEIRSAQTPEAREKAQASRPDTTASVRQVWQAIGGSLNEEWTLDYSAWFLATTAEFQSSNPGLFAKERSAILTAIESRHLQSAQLTEICSALSLAPDPKSISLLDKIQTINPDPKIQGVAALCYSIALKTLGDDGEIMRKRLTAIRKAIIQSSDVTLNGTPISKIAEDELYQIRYLSKGRIAPDLKGTDSGGRPLSISGQKGKVTVLMFWNSNIPDSDRIIEITNRLATKFANKPFTILGVNNDSLEILRSLEGNSTVNWKNFSDPTNRLFSEYRVNSLPVVYVLDGERKIQHIGSPGSFVELTVEALLQEAKPAETLTPSE